MPTYTVCARYSVCPVDGASFWDCVHDAERLWHPRTDLSHPGIGSDQHISAITFQSIVDQAQDKAAAGRTVGHAAAQTCTALRETYGHIADTDHPVIHVDPWSH